MMGPQRTGVKPFVLVGRGNWTGANFFAIIPYSDTLCKTWKTHEKNHRLERM